MGLNVILESNVVEEDSTRNFFHTNRCGSRSGRFFNQATVLQNRVERYQNLIQKIIKAGRAQIVLKPKEQESKIYRIEVRLFQHEEDPVLDINLMLPLSKEETG